MDYLIYMIFSLVLGGPFLFNENRFSHIYFDEMLNKIENQREFKIILHNLEESLIVLSD